MGGKLVFSVLGSGIKLQVSVQYRLATTEMTISGTL